MKYIYICINVCIIYKIYIIIIYYLTFVDNIVVIIFTTHLTVTLFIYYILWIWSTFSTLILYYESEFGKKKDPINNIYKYKLYYELIYIYIYILPNSNSFLNVCLWKICLLKFDS